MDQQLSRREFLRLAGLTGAAVGTGILPDWLQHIAAQPVSESQARRPNILFILVDDMGCGDLSVNGNPVIHTPNLDRLHGESRVLTQHYSASPMCAPARAAFLTGRYNHRTGAVDVPSNRGLDRITQQETTIADVLSAAGYATGLVGKWHNGVHDMDYAPLNRGFDEFYGFLNGGMDYYDWVLYANDALVEADGRYLTHALTDYTLDFIEAHADEPFFLTLSYSAPHTPLQPPPEADTEHLRATGDLHTNVVNVYAMIEDLDTQIGRVLDSLDQLGLAENTLVVFTSDNGPEGSSLTRFNCGLRGFKRNVYEGGIRMPTLLRWPQGLPQAGEDPTVSHFIDWLPTLAAVADVTLPDHLALDGVDLLPALRGESTLQPRTLFWQWNRYSPVARCNAAMLDPDGVWKLVFPAIPEAMIKLPEDDDYYIYGLTNPPELFEIDPSLPVRELSPPSPPQLFHLIDDPGETTDLADQHPEHVAAMTAMLDDWFDDVYADWSRSRSHLVTWA